MKTIYINASPEIVALAVKGLRELSISEVTFRELWAESKRMYLEDDLIAEEIPFRSDNFIDDDGEIYEEVYIHPLRVYSTEDGHRWIEGTGVKVDMTAFYETMDSILDEAYGPRVQES
jgi:hypothetical protein